MAALTFSAFFSLKREKWGPWKENGDILGTRKLKKVPMGTHLGAVGFVYFLMVTAFELSGGIKEW